MGLSRYNKTAFVKFSQMVPVELVVTLLAFSFAMGQKVPAS